MLPIESRQEFLANGLVPVGESTAECPACYREYTEPVQLPCHAMHIFCRECVTEWLSTRKVNTCPTCRAVLFHLDQDELPIDDEEEPMPFWLLPPGSAQRESILQDVLPAAGFSISPALRNDFPADPDTPFDDARLRQAILAVPGVTDALDYLRNVQRWDASEVHVQRNNEILRVEGAGRINTGRVIPAFVAVCYLIPCLGRSYPGSSWMKWCSSLARAQLPREDRSYTDVVREFLDAHIELVTGEPDALNRSDMFLLVGFAAYMAWKEATA